MSNIFSQNISPAFTKQSVSEFFVAPMFMGSDVRGDVTVRTDIKGTEKLNKITRPTMITKPKTVPGFTPNGTFELSTQNITVQPMAIEFEQNGREFWGSVMEMLLASGYKEDDVEQMSKPDVWNKIVLPVIAQAGQQDLIRQMWFCDSDHDSDDWNGYDGFFKNFAAGLSSGDIKAAQHLSFGSDGVVKVMSIDITTNLTTGDVLTVTIDDVAYTVTAGATATEAQVAADWIAANEELLSKVYRLVEYTGGKIVITGSNFDDFTVTAASSGTGAFTIATPTALTAPSLADDAVDTVMDEMVGKMPNAMLELNPVFRVSRAVYRNLFATWKALGTEIANMIMFNGLPTPHYEGIPILIHPEWDTYYGAFNNVLTNGQIVLAPQKNLLFGTDGASDSELIESWYNPEEQMRRYRVQYKAQTAYLHSQLLMLAGLS